MWHGASEVGTDPCVSSMEKSNSLLGGNPGIFLGNMSLMWKLNPRDRTITITKLLIKHAKFTPKETEIGA